MGALPIAALLVLGLPLEQLLDQRAQQVSASISAEPSWPADLYDATFLAAVSDEKIRELYRTLFADHGRILSMSVLSRPSPASAKLEATFEKGAVMPVSLTISTEPPHAIVGLWFGPPAPAIASLDALAEELGKLPGRASLCVARLGEDGAPMKRLASLRQDVPLAIGSTFKLYVLGALARDVALERHAWDEVVRLDPARASLPSGILQEWPAGGPVTLHTLASLMISVSDNTAADHLLHVVGRARVESMLEAMGNASAGNRPFLSTGEMFRLKCAGRGELAEAYVKLDPPARAAFLEEKVAPVALDSLELSRIARPVMIDRVEWFATTEELCRAMDHLRRLSDGAAGKPLLPILAINPGLDVPRDRFSYAGYKGGSEGGVLNLTYLLEGKDGAWYALSAGWNDSAAPLDETRFFGLVTRALQLLGRETAPSKP